MINSDLVLAFIFILFAVALMIWGFRTEMKKKKAKELKMQIERETAEKEVLEKQKKANTLVSKLGEIKNLKNEQLKIIGTFDNKPLFNLNDFSSLIEKNEDKIVLNDAKVIFEFIKLKDFLNDYKAKVEDSISLISKYKNKTFYLLKDTGLEDEEYRELLGDIGNFKRSIDQLKGASGNSYENFRKGNLEFNWDIDKLISDVESNNISYETEIAYNRLVGSIENIKDFSSHLEEAIATYNLYCSLACAMIIFYTNNQQLRYYEIYSSFEKMGTFDSTWQKSVEGKLEKVESILFLIQDGIFNLNQKFNYVANKLDSIQETLSTKLDNIEGGILASNILLGITAYQSYKINKNTKSLKNLGTIS